MLGFQNRFARLLFFPLAAMGLAVAGTYLYLQYTLAESLEAGISERLDTKSDIGLAYFGLLPPKFFLSSITIHNLEGFSDRYFLKVHSLRLEVEAFERASRLLTSPQMTINGLTVWIEYQGRQSNAAAIRRNLGRFERKHGITRADKTKFLIKEIRIREIEARIRAGSDNEATALPEIVLRDVGKDRNGVTIGELADIVTRAILREAVRRELKQELDERIDEEVHELKQKFDELFN